MSEKKISRGVGTNTDSSQSRLKKAVIAFAIIEALVLIPTVVYLLLR
ncbi:MAG: hypothetical protein H0T63_08135 [Pyrinomonadaceae bacterium]|nr:hypothetical protein [Pyrinomonadaceae bacterium]MDQ3584712.1 hypothetical protein [Acidobacteriota bacterium]